MIDDRPSSEPEQEALANVILALGKPSFYRALLRYAKVVCGFEHLSVFGFTPTLMPRIEVLEGLEDASITSLSAQSYMGFGYHNADPALARIRQLSLNPGAPAVLALWARDISDAAYRRDIYERFELDGRISVLGRAGQHWRSVNFYKHSRKGGLTHSDVAAISKRAFTLFAAEVRHLELAGETSGLAEGKPPVTFFQGLLVEIAPTLSHREAEVCAHALQGKTGEGTALELEITDATVATLKRRAYAKLNITNLNELFAICLAAAARRSRRL
ncbi:helix-turn-helix transcriptional regulator [Bradyrhizobium tropiciagri]|uniref:helix-turn-helix transcriptional regulator n=1 Tax=Bradyrhizobium tropiciagri TaxID=312253 RepID=UPI00067D842C|nr:helix-turn-helix transcriptional regulator [Bradyrhizobium tropiciagri]